MGLDDVELHYLPGRLGVRKVSPWIGAGCRVVEDGLVAHLEGREVDHRVGSFRGGQEDVRDLDGRREVSSVGPDLIDLHRLVGEREVVEASVRAVQESEAVFPRLDLEVGPDHPVNKDRVAEVLWDPHGMEARVHPLVRIKDRAVRVEEPVLDEQGDLVGPSDSLPVLDYGRVVSTAREGGLELEGRVSDEVETRQSRADVQPSDPEGVVVVPERRRVLRIRVVVGLVSPPGPRGVEVEGKPGGRVAVAVRSYLGTVEVDDRPDVGSTVYSVDGHVDRVLEEMRRWEFVQVCDRYWDPLHGLEGRARVRPVVAPERRGRELAVELLLELCHLDVEGGAAGARWGDHARDGQGVDEFSELLRVKLGYRRRVARGQHEPRDAVA